MFTKTDAELKKMGADITTREIQQQPSLWKETFKIYKEKKTEIDDFLAKITKKFDKVKVIFTGRVWLDVAATRQPPVWLGVNAPFIRERKINLRVLFRRSKNGG